MSNIIELSISKIYRNTPTTPEVRKSMYEELFMHNFLQKTRIVVIDLNKARILPDKILTVVDVESPGIVKNSDTCWLITETQSLIQRAVALGSNDLPVMSKSFGGFAITEYNMLLEYNSTQEDMDEGRVIHIEGSHMVDNLPESYMEHGDPKYLELLKGLSELSLRYL